MDVVFLDANVLFSAAYREDSGLRWLWELADVQLMASDYTLEEARRNLQDALALQRLDQLVGAVRVVRTPHDEPAHSAQLPPKDRPVLAAAIAGGVTVLLTGDITHFGPLFGRVVAGARILRPSVYLRARRRSTRRRS